jgi:hypothetical protein
VKALISIAALLVLGGTSAAQDPPPTLTRDQLLGAVRTVETVRIDYAMGDGKRVESRKTLLQKLTFDERGNRTESISYQPDGVISEKLIYTYDVMGRNTGYEEHYRPEAKTFSGPRKHIYTLDDSGRISEFLLFESDGSITSRFTYKYDAKGNKLEQAYYSWTGARTGKLVYTYDEAGHPLTETSYNFDEETSAWNNTDSYDAKGRKTEWVQYQNGVLRYKKLFKFNSRDRIAEEETFEFNALPNFRISHAPVPGKIVYTYDDENRSRSIATYAPDGSLKSREVRTQDDKSNDVSSEYFNADGSAKRTEIMWESAGKLSGKALLKFEYDSHGNWNRKTYAILAADAKEPQPYSAEYREITYFANK